MWSGFFSYELNVQFLLCTLFFVTIACDCRAQRNANLTVLILRNILELGVAAMLIAWKIISRFSGCSAVRFVTYFVIAIFIFPNRRV